MKGNLEITRCQCGDTSTLEVVRCSLNGKMFYVGCPGCLAFTQFFQCREDAIQQWNRHYGEGHLCQEHAVPLWKTLLSWLNK